MFFILMPLLLFDIISTEWALKHGARELNPIMKNKWVRWILTLLIKIIAVIWLFVIQISNPNVYDGIQALFIVLTVIYSIVAINNFVKIMLIKKGL